MTEAETRAAMRAALERDGIITGYLIRLDFETEVVCIWTGAYNITVTGTGDPLLDGNTFSAVQQGIAYEIGANSYSTAGSEDLEMTLALPAQLPDELQHAAIDATEYLARPATVWRCVAVQNAGLSTPVMWMYRRVRSGNMDKLEFSSDGTQNIAKLTIGSHASYVASASQSRWSDQRRFDPADTSQDYAASVANNQPLASSAPVETGGQFGGAFGSMNDRYH